MPACRQGCHIDPRTFTPGLTVHPVRAVFNRPLVETEASALTGPPEQGRSGTSPVKASDGAVSAQKPITMTVAFFPVKKDGSQVTAGREEDGK